MSKKNKPAADVEKKEVKVEENVEEKKECPAEEENKIVENTQGKLFLRYFKTNDEINPNKVVTFLRPKDSKKSKVYFPKNPQIQPGWYIATVIEENERYGIMDTIELNEVPDFMWSPEYIIGIYVKKNFQKGVVEIYKSIPRERLEQEKSLPIFEVPFETPKYESTNTIADIIEKKKKGMSK